jgi:hypothetical protein
VYLHPEVPTSFDTDLSNNIYYFLTEVTMVSNVAFGYSLQWTFVALTEEFPTSAML